MSSQYYSQHYKKPFENDSKKPEPKDSKTGEDDSGYRGLISGLHPGATVTENEPASETKFKIGSEVGHALYPKLLGCITEISSFGIEVRWNTGETIRSIARFIVPLEDVGRVTSKHEGVRSVEDDNEVEETPQFVSRLEIETEIENDEKATATEEKSDTLENDSEGFEHLPDAEDEDEAEELNADE